MADKTQFDLKKVENDVRNKAFPEENLCDIGKKSIFQKASKIFSVVNGLLMYKEKRRVILERECQQLIVHDVHDGLGKTIIKPMH